MEQTTQSTESAPPPLEGGQCAPQELLRTLKTRYENDIATIRSKYGNSVDMNFPEDVDGKYVIELIIKKGIEGFYLKEVVPLDGTSVFGYGYTLESDKDCRGHPSEVEDLRMEYGEERKDKHPEGNRFKKAHVTSLDTRAERVLGYLEENDRQTN